MFAKLLTGTSLEDLEKKLSAYLSGNVMTVQNNENKPDELRPLKIHHVHSFITQEVGKTATITAGGPARDIITKFSLMIIASYE
jgi:hypothetical protein